MKRLPVLVVLTLLTACAAPRLGTALDCGEGSYSPLSGTQNYGPVRDCLLRSFNACTESVGNLTTYTRDGDPIVDTYHVVNTDDGCRVKVVHDPTKDRSQDASITEKECTKLDILVENTPVPQLTTLNCTDN